MSVRVLTTLFSALIAIIVVGALRPPANMTGLPPDQLWAKKVVWGPEYDIIAAGNSRTVCGISPNAMSQVLPGRRIANFGFTGAAYRPEYLRSVRRLVNPEAKQPAIFLGIHPASLAGADGGTDGFVLAHDASRTSLWFQLHLGSVAYFFRPYSISQVVSAITGKESGLYQTYYSDGWVASRSVPDDPRHVLEEVSDAPGDPAKLMRPLERLLTAVRQWTNDGIRVYGARIPCNDEMLAKEDRMYGFDQREFAARFRESGGVWLSFPKNRYRSYDGSHLRCDSAQLFSRDLANAIKTDGRQNRASLDQVTSASWSREPSLRRRTP